MAQKWLSLLYGSEYAGMAAQPLPLEPICVYVVVNHSVDQGKEKMTSDTGERVRFHGHRKLAR